MRRLGSEGVAPTWALSRLLSQAQATNLAAMRTLVAEWPYAGLYWAVFIWAFAPEFVLNRRSRRLRHEQDAGSFRLVMMVQMAAIAVAFAIAFAGRLGVLPRPHLWFWASPRW